MLTLWVRRDSGIRGEASLAVWDAGLYVYIAWPLIVPYYLVKTRGLRRTSLIASVFVGCFVLGVFVERVE